MRTVKDVKIDAKMRFVSEFSAREFFALLALRYRGGMSSKT